MSWLSEWFTRNPVAANLLVLLIIVGGIFTAAGLRIEGFPRIPPSYISVDIAYPGADAKQVDDSVSLRVEKALEGMAGVKKIIALSFENSSQILIQKETDYDMVRLLNDVKTKVEGIAYFPEKAEKPVINVDEFKNFVLVVQLYGDMDERTMQDSARLLERELQADPKISKIESFGKKAAEMRLEIHEEKLKAYGISQEQLKGILRENNVKYGFGSLYGDNGYITLRADSKLHSYDKLRALPIVTDEDGSVIMLKDVATVIDAYKDRVFTADYQGQDSVGIIVYTSSKGDMIEVSKSTHKVVDRLMKQFPDNIKVDIWADYSKYMIDRIKLLQTNAWQGLLIVFVILAVFLNFKLAFWVAMGIPFSVAGAIAVMGERFLDYTINDITTFGLIIVLGILVDDAVVVGESVFEERQKAADRIDGTVKGVHKVAVATIFGVMTTIAAFYPLMLMKNDLGRILASFSGVVIAALVFSLIESKFILPAHLAAVDVSLGKPKTLLGRLYAAVQGGASGGLDFFNRHIYTPVLKTALKHRYTALVIFITCALGGIWLMNMGYVRTVFFPDIPGDVVTVNVNMESGSSDSMTYRNAEIIERAAHLTNEEVMKEKGTDREPIRKIMTVVSGGLAIEVYAELQPQAKRVIGTKELVELWREKVVGMEGVESSSFSASQETGGGFSLNVQSRNSDSLEEAVKRIKSSLAEIEGVYDIRDDLKSGEPELLLSVKSEARHLGVTPDKIASYIDSAYGGYELDRFHKESDEIKLKMIYEKNRREYIYQLLESQIELSDGSLVPLESVADIKSKFADGFIRRENGKRAIQVKAALDKEKVSASEVYLSIKDGVMEDIARELPDVSVAASGEVEEEGEMKKGLIKALVMIMLLIYALLAVPLKSYWKPFIIMSVIPFGFTGAVTGHYIAGLPVSILSFFGMLALAGIVVNDSLVMLTRFNNLLDDGHSVSEALTLAGTSRFRAIFLTTATTVCGLMPLLRETSEQAQYLIPAAVSLAYGELFATFITLLLIPLLMNIAYDIKNLFTFQKTTE